MSSCAVLEATRIDSRTWQVALSSCDQTFVAHGGALGSSVLETASTASTTKHTNRRFETMHETLAEDARLHDLNEELHSTC